MARTDNHDHHDRSGFGSGMFMGVILGAAVGYFLSTKQGKIILANWSDKAHDKIDELKHDENIGDALQTIEEKVAQVKEVVNEAASKVTESTGDPAKPKPRLFKRSGSPLRS